MSLQRSKKSILTASVDSDVYEKLERYARKRGLKLSNVVESALREFLNNEDKAITYLKLAIMEFEECSDENEKCFAAARLLRIVLKALKEGGNYCDLIAKAYTTSVEAGLC